MNNTIIMHNLHNRCFSIEIHGTMYKRGCWLIAGKRSFCGVYHLQFSQLKDILCKGENRAFFVITSSSVTEYPPHHLVCLMSSIVSIIHPSSLLYHEPASSVCKQPTLRPPEVHIRTIHFNVNARFAWCLWELMICMPCTWGQK